MGFIIELFYRLIKRYRYILETSASDTVGYSSGNITIYEEKFFLAQWNLYVLAKLVI